MNSDIERKREALQQGLTQFLSYCDQAEELITAKEVTPSPVLDFTSLIDQILPLPLDKSDPQGSTQRQLEEMVRSCKLCALSEGQENRVFGDGALPARLMVIGEAPDEEDNRMSKAFVGPSGQYLDTWLAPVGLFRTTNVYMASLVKCYPPEGRTPLASEIASCLPYLRRQIQLAKPELILLVGEAASNALLNSDEDVPALRGRFHRYEGLPVLVTYHPNQVLEQVELKRPVWDDVKKVASFLNLPLPGQGR